MPTDLALDKRLHCGVRLRQPRAFVRLDLAELQPSKESKEHRPAARVVREVALSGHHQRALCVVAVEAAAWMKGQLAHRTHCRPGWLAQPRGALPLLWSPKSARQVVVVELDLLGEQLAVEETSWGRRLQV